MAVCKSWKAAYTSPFVWQQVLVDLRYANMHESLGLDTTHVWANASGVAVDTDDAHHVPNLGTYVFKCFDWRTDTGGAMVQTPFAYPFVCVVISKRPVHSPVAIRMPSFDTGYFDAVSIGLTTCTDVTRLAQMKLEPADPILLLDDDVASQLFMTHYATVEEIAFGGTHQWTWNGLSMGNSSQARPLSRLFNNALVRVTWTQCSVRIGTVFDPRRGLSTMPELLFPDDQATHIVLLFERRNAREVNGEGRKCIPQTCAVYIESSSRATTTPKKLCIDGHTVEVVQFPKPRQKRLLRSHDDA
ncbi:MAG: hypothetical protein NZ744_08170 [Pirellulaceae bacterium]|nr:hypothetical protein [Pirellulaceae bacterium]